MHGWWTTRCGCTHFERIMGSKAHVYSSISQIKGIAFDLIKKDTEVVLSYFHSLASSCVCLAVVFSVCCWFYSPLLFTLTFQMNGKLLPIVCRFNSFPLPSPHSLQLYSSTLWRRRWPMFTIFNLICRRWLEPLKHFQSVITQRRYWRLCRR